MPEIKKVFLRGKMNKDLDERLLPDGEYRDASNIQVSSTESSDAGTVQNLLGNKKLPIDGNVEESIYLAFGNNSQCLGSISDEDDNKIYFFIKGDDSLNTVTNAIISYDTVSYKISPILIDSRDENLKALKFPNNKITGIATVENFLVFTDNTNEPKIIDISSESNFENTEGDFITTTTINNSAFDESDITLIKKKPNNAPKIGFTLTNDNSEITDTDRRFEDKFIRFAYRWQFLNGQYSVFSPFSEPLFFPSEANNYDIETGFNKQMVNNIKLPKLYNIEANLKDINKVEILYKESNNANVYLYKRINKTDAESTAGTSLTDGASVEGENLFGVISENELLRHYDNVPFAAKSLETVGNRIIFGNYKDGLNCDLNISFNSKTLTPRSKIVDSSNAESLRNGRIGGATNNLIKDKASVKTGRKYQFGVVLEDEYGRQSPVLTNNDNGFYEQEFSTGDGFGKKFQLSMSNITFDDRVKTFKYYIKNTSKEYYNVVVKDVYENEDDNGITAWLVLPSYEINKINDEDFIILKKAINSNNLINYSATITEPGASSDTTVSVEDYKFKVLSIKNSKPDSLSSSKKFEDSFFVKIKNNAVIKEHLLKQQGAENSVAGGSLNILENDFEGNYTGGGIEIGYFEDSEERTTYYFKNGRVYDDIGSRGASPPTSSTSGLSAIPTSNVASTLGFTPDNLNNWVEIVTDGTFSISLPYNDTSGDVNAIYARLGDTGFRYFDQVVVKYSANSAGGSNPVTDFSPAVFETIPEEDGLDIYYEASDSIPIDDWTNDIELNYVNCFVMGNGVESDRIRDDFNEDTIGKGVRVSTTTNESFKERKNSSGLIFSGIFNSETNLNELNKFNTANTITKVVNPKHGDIQKLHSRDNDLAVLCEDKIMKIPVNKQLLFNADGSENLAASNRVLGTEIPYDGNYGISKNPESFAAQGYRSYFTDKARGVVLRLTKNGVTIISDNGMTDYFRENLSLETNDIIGSYDVYSNQYILSLPTKGESLSFKEDVKGWVSRLSFVPESGVSVNGNYYTFKQGHIYAHNALDGDNNKFYGVNYSSGIQLIFNQEPSSIKNFKTISYEGSEGWATVENGIDIIKTDQQKGQINEFIKKEGKYFGVISGVDTELISIPVEELNTRLKDLSIQGLGNITSHSGILEFTCNTAGFSISDSNTLDSNGAAISAISQSSVTAGTLVSVLASNGSANIQSGLNTYTAQIRVPNGYSNTGEVVSCTDTATGTAVDPEFTCATAGLNINNGTVGTTVTGSVSVGTIASYNPTTYSSNSNTQYKAIINIPSSGYSNSGTIECQDTDVTVSAASCAFSLTPGGSYSSGNYTLQGNFSGTDYTNSDTITLSVQQGNIGIGSAGSSQSVNTTKNALAGGLTIYSNQGIEITATITNGLCNGESATADAPTAVGTVAIGGSTPDTAFTYDLVTLTAQGSNMNSFQWFKGTTSGSLSPISNENSQTLETSESSADTIYYKVQINGSIDSPEHDIVYSNRTLISGLKYEAGSLANSAACTSSTQKNVYVKPLGGSLTSATEFFSDIQGNKNNLQGTYSDSTNYRFISSTGLPDPHVACSSGGGTQYLGLRDCRNTISEINVEVDIGNNNTLSTGDVISFTSNIGNNQYFYVNSIKNSGDTMQHTRTLANTHTSCLAVDPPTIDLAGSAIVFAGANISLNAQPEFIPQGASFTYIYRKSTDGSTPSTVLSETTNANITDTAPTTAGTNKYTVEIKNTNPLIKSNPPKEVSVLLYYQHNLKYVNTGSNSDSACTSGSTQNVFANINYIAGTITQLYSSSAGSTSGFAAGTYSDGDIHGYFNSNGQLQGNWANCPAPASPSVEIQYPQGTSTQSVNANAYATVNLYALASNFAGTVNYTWTKNSSTVQGPSSDNTYGASLSSTEIANYSSPITHTYGVTASDGTNSASDPNNITVVFTVATQDLTARLCPNGASYNFRITNASGYTNGQVLNLTGGGFTDGCYEITNASYSGSIDYSAAVAGSYPYAPSNSCCDCTGCSVTITDDEVASAEVGDTVTFTASPSGYSATNYAWYTRTQNGSYPPANQPTQTGNSNTFSLTQSSAGLIYVKVIATATGVSREDETNQNWSAPVVPVERFYQAQSYTSNCGNDDSIIEVRYTSLTALQVGTVFDTGGSICYRTTSSGSTSGNSSSYELQSVNFHDSCTACQNAQSADCSFTLSRSGYDSTNGGVTVTATFGTGHTNTTNVGFHVSAGSVSPGTATKAQLEGNGVFLTLSPSVTLTGTINSSDSCNLTTDDVGIPQSTCNEITAWMVSDNPATSSTAANELCGAFLPLRVRVNGTSLATSSQLYSGAGCTTLLSGTKYLSQNNNQYYIWNGSSLSGPYTLNCP
jgi:hypothetical protein